MTRSPRLVYLQYVRAAAALGVVLYHVSFYTHQAVGFDLPLQVFNGHFGFYGVTAFFVISGYLMSSLIQDTTPARFLAHRFLRIYPMYWLLAALVIVTRTFMGIPQPVTPAVLLLPVGLQYSPLNIEWTLVYEVFYYALTGLFCLAALRRWHTGFLLSWLTTILVLDQFYPHFARQNALDFHYLAVSVWNVPFLLGGLGYYALRQLKPNIAWFLGGLSLLLISLVHDAQSQFRLTPLGMAFLLLYLIHRNQENEFHEPNDVFRALGDYSYGLYLIHVPVAQFTLNYVKVLHPRQPQLIWLVAFGCSVAAGCTAGVFDVWLYARLKRFADRRLRQTAPLITTARA